MDYSDGEALLSCRILLVGFCAISLSLVVFSVRDRVAILLTKNKLLDKALLVMIHV